MIRRGYYTGEMMVVLVTRTAKLFPQSKIIPAILEALPEVVSIVQNVNPKQNNVILGDETIVLHGEDVVSRQTDGPYICHLFPLVLSSEPDPNGKTL